MIVLKPLDYKPVATFENPIGKKLDGTYRQPFANIVTENGKTRIELHYVTLPVEVMHVMAKEADRAYEGINKQLELYTNLSKLYKQEAASG